MTYKILEYAYQQKKDEPITQAAARILVIDMFGNQHEGFFHATEQDLVDLNKGIPIEEVIVPSFAEVVVKIQVAQPVNDIIQVSKQELEQKVIDQTKVDEKVAELTGN
jgi:hypothetical protein